MEHSYKKLLVYVRAKNLVLDVYSTLKLYPNEERYALCDQMRRSAISIPSNIAEGMSRTSTKEQCHFLEIAYGSLMELECQLDISKDLKYIKEDKENEFCEKIDEIARMLSGLRKSLNASVSKL